MSYDQYGQSGQQNNPPAWGGNEGEQNPWSNPQEQGTSQPSANYPASQPSAGYLGGQPAEAYPESQSAAYPESQSSAGYPGAQAPAAYGYDAGQQASQQPQQGWTAQQGQPTQQFGAQQSTEQLGWGANPATTTPTGPQQKGLFGTLFDFSFSDYATPALAKVLYILGIVLGGLAWLGGPAQILLASSTMSAFGSSGSMFAVLALFALIVGLVPLAFWIIGLRMCLEFVLATVRTQQDTAAMRAQQDQQNN